MWTGMLLCLEQFEELTVNNEGQKKWLTFDEPLIKSYMHQASA